MADVLIRHAEPADAEELFANLRAPDRTEIVASGGGDVYKLIAQSIRGSVVAWSGFVDGKLACTFGVGPLSILSGIGAPWMLGTDELDRHSRILIRLTPDYISAMLQVFPELENYVHADNKVSVRWLKRLGFHLHPAAPYGVQGKLFHKFTMRA